MQDKRRYFFYTNFNKKNQVKKALLLIAFMASYQYSFSQISYPHGGIIEHLVYSLAVESMPEHGFLSGKKFPTYETVDAYDFNGKKIKIVLFDDRDSLNLTKTVCSDIVLTNSSEFKNEQGIVKVWEYLNKLSIDSKLVIDKDAADEYEIRLMALDTRQG